MIDGTCRYVLADVSSNGQYTSELFYDADTQASASLQIGSPGDYSFFSGRSAADVSAGTLKAFIHTIGGGGANAAWIETVVFTLPEGLESIDLPVNVRIEGVSTHRQSASYNNIYTTFQAASYGNANHFDVVQFVGGCGFGAEFTDAIRHEGPVSFDYTDTLRICSDVFYQFAFSLSVGGTDITQDFGNTATFSWDLPTGVSAASSSGRFLSEATPGAVPEPSTWAMLIVGFGLIGASLRSRRATARFASAA